jgi:hypothetical protein
MYCFVVTPQYMMFLAEKQALFTRFGGRLHHNVYINSKFV